MNVASRDNQQRRLSRILHTVGLLLLLVAAGTLYEFLRQHCTLPRRECEREAARLTTVLQTAEDAFARQRLLRAELDALQRNAQEIIERIPDEPCEAEFLGQVSQAAEEVELTIRNYERRGTTAAASHTEFDIRLDCLGSYASICRFLDRLDRSRRMAVVKKLSITASAQPEISVYPLDLTLTLFYRTGSRAENG